MAGQAPEERVRFPVLVSDWRRVAFLHWPVDLPERRLAMPPVVRHRSACVAA